jgi:hypothetical protein
MHMTQDVANGKKFQPCSAKGKVIQEIKLVEKDYLVLVCSTFFCFFALFDVLLMSPHSNIN